MIFEDFEYHRLAGQAKHIQGKVSVLQSLKSTKLTSHKIREICNDLYLRVGEFLVVLEKIENNHGGKRTVEKEMRARGALIKIAEEFSKLSEDMLSREITVKIGDVIYPIKDIALKDSEQYHTADLWGRIEIVIETGKPIVKHSPIKGWIKCKD